MYVMKILLLQCKANVVIKISIQGDDVPSTVFCKVDTEDLF